MGKCLALARLNFSLLFILKGIKARSFAEALPKKNAKGKKRIFSRFLELGNRKYQRTFCESISRFRFLSYSYRLNQENGFLFVGLIMMWLRYWGIDKDKTDDEEFYIPLIPNFKNCSHFLKEAQKWQLYYNTQREHSGYGMNNLTPLEKIRTMS
ncbi:MAG: hypothetical protein ABIK76_05490 [candidate division WOR-3 bacterium]